MGLNHWEIVAVLVIVLLLFGPKNLPRLAQSLGRSVRELKNGLSGVGEELHKAADERQAPEAPRQSSAEVSNAQQAQRTDSEAPKES